MGSNCCKGEAGAQVYKGNGTEISIGPRLRKSPVYTEMMREETFQVDETPHIGAPFFLRKLNDYTVLVGTKAKLSVHISNTKDAKVSWFKDDLLLPETDRYVCSSLGQLHSLEIATVLPEDNAKWSCQGENSFGKCVCSGQLTVRVPETYKAPEFVDELRAILTSQGTISLECKVIGYPTPELSWFKDGNEIKAGDMFGLTINGGDLGSLGVYTCVAKNCVGTNSSSSKVRVQETQETTIKDKTIDKISPVFIEELERIKGKIGDRLELRCKINLSADPVSVRWYNQSGLIEANEKYSMFEDGLGCFIVDINAAELCDAGEWKCVITCKDGLIGITTNVVELDVPRNYRAPRFMEGLKAVLTEEGLVSFECKVIGYPTPILRWYKDGRELKPGDVYHLTGVNSLGSYCCVARNSLGEASSTTFLSVNDIKAQLNEEEWMNLLQVNQAPIFKTGLISRDVNIAESFRLSVVISSVSRPTVNWYKDDLVVDGTDNYKISSDESTYTYSIDVVTAQLDDQGEWKCVATNEFGQAGTSCFVKLIIPKHYRKPKFLENLKAVMLRDGTVNLECKVIGVPQPVLKWYKDGTELKPGDIHRIITGQDGKCCLGTYTCEAVNCMGSVSSTASLHGYDGIADEGPLPPEGAAALVKDASLSTIHEERTSQIFDTAASYESAASNGRGEISFTFDGKEVSVSLYETPELTNDEALQIVQMFADQLHQNINENENVTNMPSLRFVKETSTSGQLVMEALVIDVPVVEDANLFEDDRRTDFDIDEMHDENTFTFESGIASSKVRTQRHSSNDQDEFRSMTSSEHSDLERDVMMSILSRDSLPVLTSPAKTVDVATGDDTRQRLLSLVETVIFHLASIREEVRNQSDLAITASFMERSDKILADILYPVQQLHKNLANTSTLESLLDPLELLARGLSVVEKCVQIGGYSRTFVYRTSVCIVEGCGKQILNCLTDLRILAGQQLEADFVTQQKIYMAILEIQTSIESAQESIQSQRILQQADSVAAMQDVTSIVTNRSIFEDIDFILKSEEPLGLLQVKNLQITVLEFEKSLATILTIVSQSENCNVRSEIARFGLTEVLLELKNKTEVLMVQCSEQRQQKIVGSEMKPAVVELNSLVEMVEANESYAEVISCLNDMFVPLEEMKTALSKLTNELRHVPESEYNSNQALEQQIEEFYELIVHLKEEIQRASKDFRDSADVFERLEECLNRLFCIHTADSIDNEECARMEIVLIQLLMNHLTKLELSLQEKTEQDMLSFMATAFLNVHDNLQHFSYMRSNSKYEKIRQDILHHARKMVFFLIETETSLTTVVERRKAIYEMALFSIHTDCKRIREATEKYAIEIFGERQKCEILTESLDSLSECATAALKSHEQSQSAENEVVFDSLLRFAISMRTTCDIMDDQTMTSTIDADKILNQYTCLQAAAESYALYNTNEMARSSETFAESLTEIVKVATPEKVFVTYEENTKLHSQCQSIKASIADLKDFIGETKSASVYQKPLTELEDIVETLVGQPTQLESIEFVNAIASPIAKATETLKNIDLQAAHVQPSVVLEDCLLEMCASLEKAQTTHTVEKAQESTAHFKLVDTVTHVQHDIRECIQLEKDTREKNSKLQQGALESLKQSLSEVQQLVKSDIVVKEVSKPLVALETTINELIGQPMQLESIEFVNAIASPIAKVTETLKNIDLQAAHVQPTVVVEDCLLEMCASLEKAQTTHTVEKAQESTAHSKLVDTVTHVQHDIRECIQLEKDTREKNSKLQQGALESLKQSLFEVQQLVKSDIVVKEVSKPLVALETTINELIGQPMQLESIEFVNAIASPIAKVTETLKNIDLQAAHMQPTVVLEDCLLEMCASLEKAQTTHTVEKAQESTAHFKLVDTVTHVQHDIRECIQLEKDTREKNSKLQQGALESLKQSLSEVQQLVKSDIVVKEVSKPLVALETTINELIGQPMQLESIEFVNAIASPIAKVTETLKKIDLQAAHVQPTVVLEDCLLEMCASLEKAQTTYTVEKAQESTAHSKLVDTVTHVQHDIRECIQLEKDTREKNSKLQQGALESLKQSLSEVQQLVKSDIVVKEVSKPLVALETTINELIGQPMQLESIEFVNAIASPIAKVTETLKNIDLQAAHVQPTVVVEDCLLEMCASLEKAQTTHTVEKAQESTAHSKLVDTVTHVQHDIRECIQLEKDTREKNSKLQQGALESLKQSLSEVQQLVKSDIVVKEVSKPLVALETTINELIGQPMQLESIEFVNAIASPIAKVTETLKNIDLQAAHVQPTVVLEDCLLEMCASLEKAQTTYTVEKAQESTAHSKLVDTVTHVQHDIRECIQLEKDTREKNSKLQQGALESLKQSLFEVQQLVKSDIVLKEVSKPLVALETTINELIGQPMQLESIEFVNAIASPIAKVTETLKKIDLQAAHVQPTVVLEDCLLEMCASLEKAQTTYTVEKAQESTAHSKLVDTVTHVQHDIRECIQLEKDTREKNSKLQQGALESLKQSLSEVQQLVKSDIVVKEVSKPLVALETTINELIGQPMQLESIEFVNAIASPIAKVTETLKNIDLQAAHVQPTVVVEDCLLEMCASLEKAQTTHTVEKAQESTAHSKLVDTVTHVQHDIRECIQLEKDTREKNSKLQQGALESLKQSLSEVQQLVKSDIVVKEVSKPLVALETTINELIGQPMQLESIEFVNAIASPIAKVTETLKNIDLQAAHVQPTVVLEDCLLEMCASLEKAQTTYTVEKAQESTAHSKLVDTVTHVQHDIRECIQLEKDTREKNSKLQQGALESLKQSLFEVQQLVKSDIVLKEVSKPLVALETTINELIGQPMQLESIEFVNAIASPIAKVTETLKKIDLQAAHVQPTVVLEDCLLEMCASLEKAQTTYTVEKAQESTAHSKLVDTVTHVQHDIRECIQLEKDTREKNSKLQQGALESLKQSLSEVQQLVKSDIVVKEVSKPLVALETTINELIGQPMQLESIEFVNAIASPIAKVTETLKNIDLQAAHVQPTVVVEDCLLEMCASLEKAQTTHTVEKAQESTAHSKLVDTVTHVQHDIRECIQLEKDTREKNSKLQQGALESLKQSLSEVQQLVKSDIVVKEVSKPLVALETTINELIGQPMQLESIEFVNAIASPIAKVTETLKNIDLQAAHVQPTVVLEDCLLEMCASLEKAQTTYTVEKAQESTAHSKLVDTVTHVQHDIRECIQLEKDTREKNSKLQQGALESLKQSLSEVQQLVKSDIVVKEVSKPLVALETTINELIGQPMQLESIEFVNAIASPIAKVTETLKKIDLQAAHVQPTVVLEDCLLEMCASLEKAQTTYTVEKPQESTAHSKLVDTVTHVQHDIRECIQLEKDTREKNSKLQQGALESLKQSLFEVQQLVKSDIVLKEVSKPLVALETTINELIGQPMQLESIEFVNAFASPIAKVTETLKKIDLQAAHVQPTVVLEDCLLEMCASLEKAQTTYTVEKAQESTAHSKLVDTVTHVQHDIRECIQLEKDTREKNSKLQQGALESLKQSLSEVQQLVKSDIVVKEVSKPLVALETTINELIGQPMQLESIEFVNAIASPIAKVTETLKNIDLQAAHVQPTVVVEDCLLEMCASLEKAQTTHTVEKAQESTAHSKLVDTVTHVQHDIRECIQLEKDTREKNSKLQQGALESLKQSLSEVQQLVKSDIVVKEVSKPLVALETTINELIGQPMQLESIEFVNAIASPIAKVTETLKNIDLQAAHVQPTVVLEDCLLEMCASLEKAQTTYTVEKAQESTAHSKLVDTVTHVQHDIRECIHLEKDTREKNSKLQQGALESLKQSLSEVQQLVKSDIVVKEVSKPLVALETTINELIGQPMQLESIEFVNAIASPIAKVTETLKNIDLQAAHVQPSVVLEDCLLEMCASLEKAQTTHTVEKAQESTAHSKLIDTVTHVQHDIRECIQLEKDTREKNSKLQQGALESLKQSLSEVQQFVKSDIVVKEVSKPLVALETTINELIGQPMQLESIEFVNAIASPIAKVTETLKNIDLQAAHVQPTVVLEDCLLEMCASLEKAQTTHTVEKAQESTAHSKLVDTVTHVQHDIRECIQLEKDTREKNSKLQQGALESLKQSLSEVQQLVKSDIVVKEVSKPLVALETTINELIGQPMQLESIEFVNAIASSIAKVTETLKNIDLQAAHVQPTVVVEDCLLEITIFENAFSWRRTLEKRTRSCNEALWSR
ncbi:uncharacterized protein LOC131261405 [Anopheles coustani]|uniref:uncharacterized protein LOC131261405 n=1 Tax=Anopheles coustani TaxID=139045 RepID=UPI002657B93A|nr:uncharacterized protein LOC131261405 [Anopheles coustani]